MPRPKKPAGASFVSRPAILPSTKDALTGATLDALDSIRDALDEKRWVNDPFPRQLPSGKTKLRTKKGARDTIWLATAVYSGDWSYARIAKAFKESKAEFPRKQLVFITVHYTETENDGNEGHISVGPIQVWESARQTLIRKFSPTGDGPGKHYKHAKIDSITIRIASEART